MQTQTLPQLKGPAQRFTVLNRYFYFAMSLVTIAVVVYGFHFTVGQNLIHAAVPRPRLVYVHAVVFTGWLAFFLMQSVLVRTRNVRAHRTLGWIGVGLGIAVVITGIATTLVMVAFKRDILHQGDAEAFMIVPLLDMVCFGSTFALAIMWRKKPEFHRRLFFITTCALTAAGWGRFPPTLMPGPFAHVGVDLLILTGVVRDLLVDRRVHTVYRHLLPVFAVAQTFAIVTLVRTPKWWLTVAHRLTS
jgi:hypothetical protein